MKIRKETLSPIDYECLTIIDYTAGEQTRFSIAEITVASSARQRSVVEAVEQILLCSLWPRAVCD